MIGAYVCDRQPFVEFSACDNVSYTVDFGRRSQVHRVLVRRVPEPCPHWDSTKSQSQPRLSDVRCELRSRFELRLAFLSPCALCAVNQDGPHDEIIGSSRARQGSFTVSRCLCVRGCGILVCLRWRGIICAFCHPLAELTVLVEQEPKSLWNDIRRRAVNEFCVLSQSKTNCFLNAYLYGCAPNLLRRWF